MKIDNDLLDNLLAEASKSTRSRMNLDLRTSPDDSSQRMLNALLPGTKVPIHRHTKSTETLLLLRGRMEEIYYEVDGESHFVVKETERVTLSVDGDIRGLSIPVGQWHSLNILEPTVILECKDGAYEPRGEEDMIG